MIKLMLKVDIRDKHFAIGKYHPNLQEDFPSEIYKTFKKFYHKTLWQINMDIYGMDKTKADIEARKAMHHFFDKL